jgi:hypothetical protein
LAVLNFIFAGFSVLALLAVWALLATLSTAADAAGDSGAALQHGLGSGQIYAGVALLILTITLLIMSGVGYLGQKRFMGRTLGTTYAVISIASSIFGVIVLKQSFGISNIIGLVYPVLTIILLNTTFKEDLVN